MKTPDLDFTAQADPETGAVRLDVVSTVSLPPPSWPARLLLRVPLRVAKLTPWVGVLQMGGAVAMLACDTVLHRPFAGMICAGVWVVLLLLLSIGIGSQGAHLWQATRVMEAEIEALSAAFRENAAAVFAEIVKAAVEGREPVFDQKPTQH